MASRKRLASSPLQSENNMEISLDRLESTVVDECATIFESAMYDREKVLFRVPADTFFAIARHIGVRMTRLAVSKAGLVPAPDDSDDWITNKRGPKTTIELHPADFGHALDQLDIDGRLARALGLS
jgi:hypothetical protein